MASACKCDACGKLYESKGYSPDVTIDIYHHVYGSSRIDLCPECQKKLEKFIHYKSKEDFNQ